MLLEDKYLKILGLVDKNVINKMTKTNNDTQPNTFWFFVDYAAKEYGLNSEFDIVFEGEEKRMLPHIYTIKLLTAMDQFGYNLDAIPYGWQTISKFEFIGDVPKEVYTLPILNEWHSNKNCLRIANHNDLTIEVDTLNRKVYTQVFTDFFAYALHSNPKNKKDFLNSFLNIYKENEQELKDKVPTELFKEAERQLLA